MSVTDSVWLRQGKLALIKLLVISACDSHQLSKLQLYLTRNDMGITILIVSVKVNMIHYELNYRELAAACRACCISLNCGASPHIRSSSWTRVHWCIHVLKMLQHYGRWPQVIFEPFSLIKDDPGYFKKEKKKLEWPEKNIQHYQTGVETGG